MPDRKKGDEAKGRANPAVGFGTSFAVGMALFALGGHWLDKKTGHESLFTLIGIGLGLLYGAWELWKMVAMTNEQSRHEDENKEPPRDGPEK
jgi:hypothetical protein